MTTAIDATSAAPQIATPAVTPVAATERIQSLDVLRGFALLGTTSLFNFSYYVGLSKPTP